ncbi:unnamed protein product [Schistosoma turkestanicum]|nr:unnamed protein product [Schistosoma turkestanicum]
MDRQLTEQELRTMFDHMDKNHNGYVTAKELKSYLKAHDAKVTNKEVKEFIRKLDESGDGQISLHEFMKGLIADIKDLFGKLDKNHNGLVSQKELKAYLRENSVKYNGKEVKDFVAKIDDNSDGQISLEELTKALTGNFDPTKVCHLKPR